MGIERARVVEVFGAGSPAGAAGAGYLIGERLVLTAGDVAGPTATEVRVGATVDWCRATTVWSAPAGVAIVEADEPLAAPATMRWGGVSGPRPVPVAAMGFPPTRGRPDGWRDAEPFFGQLRGEALEPAPASRLTGAGVHGAALFAGGELVAVVAAGRDRLRVMPASSFVDDPSFVALVGQVELVPVRTTPGLSIL